MALAKLTSDQVKAFVTSGAIEVAGISLSSEDLQVVRYIDESKKSIYQSNSDKDVLILLDTTVYESLQEEGLAREVINRVQRLRKKTNLQPHEEVSYFVKFIQDPIGLEAIIGRQQENLVKILKRQVVCNPPSTQQGIIVEEEQEVNGATFSLTLVRDMDGLQL